MQACGDCRHDLILLYIFRSRAVHEYRSTAVYNIQVVLLLHVDPNNPRARANKYKHYNKHDSAIVCCNIHVHMYYV